MGRLIVLFGALLTVPCLGDDYNSPKLGISELHRDIIREYYAEYILGYSKGFTDVPGKLEKLRHTYKPTYLIKGRSYPAYQQDQKIRIFNKSPVSVDEILSLIAKSTDYSILSSKDINLKQDISLGEDFYSIPDIVNYINVITNLHIDISEEAKSLTVFPDETMN